MTSTVISIWGFEILSPASAARNGFSVPNASECMTDVDAGPSAFRVQDLRHLGERLGPLLLVGGVHVEEHRPGPGGFDPLGDALHVRERRPAVEVHAEDVAPASRERERAGFAEAGRGAEDERPVAVAGHRSES